MSVSLKNNPIWYKVGSRDANMVNQLQGKELIFLRETIKAKSALSEAADALILQAKSETQADYIILNDDYFQNDCKYDFKELVKMFKIKRTNPIPSGIFLCHYRIETQQIHSFIHLLSC